MKIAFLCHPYHRGGVTRWMVDFATECSQKKLDVYFVVVEPKKKFVSAGGKETIVSLIKEGGQQIKLISQKVGYEYELGTMEYRAFINAKLLRNNVPFGTPVIVSDDDAVWHTSKYLGHQYPYVGVLHADDSHYYEHARKYSDYISQFVCVSERIRNSLLEINKTVDRNKACTIPCGIILPSKKLEERGNGYLSLVYVGRLDEYQKRSSDIILIAKALRESNHFFRLDVIGEGPQLNELQQRSDNERLDKYINFHGWQKKADIYKRLASADILLLPSNFEGMPIAVMEALSCSCGVVATRVSGVEDYEHLPVAKECIALYDVGKVNEALEAIKKLLAIPKIVRIRQARAFAEMEFSMDICIERYINVVIAITDIKVKKVHVKFIALGFLYSRIISILRRLKLRFS